MNQQHLLPGLNQGPVVATPPGASPTGGPWPPAQPSHAYSQTEGVSLEWRITGLKAIFEQTRGDTKSRVVKSALFGGGRWQILWYPNAGGPMGSEWTSLYLSCEPLPEEYLSSPAAPDSMTGSVVNSSGGKPSAAVSPAFERKGVYRFKFAITAGDKLISAKEDKGHEFRTECGNWGWQSFIRRDTLYFDNTTVRRLDAFTITCEVTSQPEPPRLPDPTPRTLLPTDLVDTIGRLLDQESYSDVEFVIAPHRKPSAAAGRSIFANKTMLARAEYFATMLSSGFAEDLQVGAPTLSLADEGDALDNSPATGLPELDDSDRSDAGESSDESDDDDEEDDDDVEHGLSTSSPTPTPHSLLSSPGSSRNEPLSAAQSLATSDPAKEGRSQDYTSSDPPPSVQSAQQGKRVESAPRTRSGPRKTRVVIRDASYPSYFALLYFLYTETITFAPITSSFHLTAAGTGESNAAAEPPVPRRPSHAPQPSTSSSYRSFASSTGVTSGGVGSSHREAVRRRAAWIDDWVRTHPGRPRPASAKSLFVLADKMGLSVLKAKAFGFIVDSLSVETIAYEAFTDLAAAYDEIRHVHIDFMLQNWQQIRQTEALSAVWSQLRTGTGVAGRRRPHAGFESVWPLIVGQLDFVPRPLGAAGHAGGAGASAVGGGGATMGVGIATGGIGSAGHRQHASPADGGGGGGQTHDL